MPLRLENIFRYVDQHRSGAAARGNVERFVHNLRQLGEILHQEIVLGAGARDAEGVGFLEGIAADEFGRDLPGDGDDGNGIHHGIHQARDQVGGAGSGGGATDAHFTSGAGVALGRETCIFFVPHQHVADVVVIHGIVEGQRHAAGVAEKAVHPLPSQTFQQHLRATHQIRHILCLKNCPYNTKGHQPAFHPR